MLISLLAKFETLRFPILIFNLSQRAYFLSHIENKNSYGKEKLRIFLKYHKKYWDNFDFRTQFGWTDVKLILTLSIEQSLSLSNIFQGDSLVVIVELYTVLSTVRVTRVRQTLVDVSLTPRPHKAWLAQALVASDLLMWNMRKSLMKLSR